MRAFVIKKSAIFLLLGALAVTYSAPSEAKWTTGRRCAAAVALALFAGALSTTVYVVSWLPPSETRLGFMEDRVPDGYTPGKIALKQSTQFFTPPRIEALKAQLPGLYASSDNYFDFLVGFGRLVEAPDEIVDGWIVTSREFLEKEGKSPETYRPTSQAAAARVTDEVMRDWYEHRAFPINEGTLNPYQLILGVPNTFPTAPVL